MLRHLLNPARGCDQTPSLSVAKRLLLAERSSLWGPVILIVSLTGVRDQTNYYSAVCPSCLSISVGLTFHVTLMLFSKPLVFKVNLRLDLVQARRCVPAVGLSVILGDLQSQPRDQAVPGSPLAALGWISSVAQPAWVRMLADS